MPHRRLSVPRSVARPVVTALTGLLALSACSSGETADPGSSQSWDVVASFYPLQFVAEQVGGGRVAVTNLTKPGAEPHDLELAPQDLGALTDADLAIYLADFQPAVDDAVAQKSGGQVLDVSDAADLSLTYQTDETDGDALTDPHFWLDLMRMADVADDVAAALSQLDPPAQATFEANAAKLRSELEHLDTDFRKGLADCERRQLVTSHTAFGYLADAYGLEQVGLTGLSPDTEPNPQELATVTEFVADNDVQTIFYETLVSPDVAETVANATGASTDVLDPLEGLTDSSQGDDYLQVMESNLANIKAGLPCR
ncbi:MAG: metal ABC transporter substrate-binding protein [Actinomycetia bacterium]|nr:metal ABC transporter substrate-binding protein [Actinomycetes bacterium]